AHARDDRLAGFFIGTNAEGRILSSKALQGEAHLFLIGLGFRLDSNIDHGIGEDHALEDNRRLGNTQGVTGRGVLETNDRNDIASISFRNLLAAVGVHLEHTADALTLVLDRVLKLRTGFELARIDTAEG